MKTLINILTELKTIIKLFLGLMSLSLPFMCIFYTENYIQKFLDKGMTKKLVVIFTYTMWLLGTFIILTMMFLK